MTPYNLKLSSEYLIRAELSPAERTMHIGKRKKLYEKLHPETRATEVGGPGRAKTRRQIGDDIAERFTKNTAKKRNRPERRRDRVRRGGATGAGRLCCRPGPSSENGHGPLRRRSDTAPRPCRPGFM
jgi:hypothetical protein